jgi:2-oxo-4-hydroxy-4-carboxy-5-ureidoimidazoline decarboxylase
MRLEDFNALDDEAAARELLRCGSSSRWTRLMAAARPFADAAGMAVVADVVWTSLAPADWLEAFAAHPKIGAAAAATAGRAAGAGASGWEDTGRWSDDEQAGVAGAPEATLRRLAQANREYEAHFGYIFIICATGLTAAAMLEALERRLRHAPDVEMQAAAEEQRKITRLRLAKLLVGEQDLKP